MLIIVIQGKLLVTKGIATRSKKLLVAPGITTKKKLLVTKGMATSNKGGFKES